MGNKDGIFHIWDSTGARLECYRSKPLGAIMRRVFKLIWDVILLNVHLKNQLFNTACREDLNSVNFGHLINLAGTRRQ